MSLLAHLDTRRGDARLFFLKDRWFTVDEVRRLARQLRSKMPEVQRSSAMLVAGNAAEAVLGMLAMDGFVSRLLLAAATHTEETRKGFALQAETEHTVFCDSWNDSLFSESGRESENPPIQELDTAWIIPTSGTTGGPKLVEHSLESLSGSVKRDATRGEGLVWGLLYDVTRFAGIQVLLQAIIGGSALAIASDITDAITMQRDFAAAGVNALSATPSMWRKLVMAGLLDGLDIRFVTLGGETADDMILGELRSRFPNARITHIYASTEAGVGFSVTDGRAGFPAAYLNGELPGGVTLRVDEQGRLFVRKNITGGHYIASDASITDDEGWIDTGDLVERRGDRWLFLGRSSGTINVGGQKVHPTEIERIIQSVEGVAMVAVRGRRNPIMGSLVEALIVPAKGYDPVALDERVMAACMSGLDAYKVPASIKIVDEIPLTPAGKIVRQS